MPLPRANSGHPATKVLPLHRRAPKDQAVHRPSDVKSCQDATGHNENKPTGQGWSASRPSQASLPGHEKSGFFSATLLTCRGRFRRAPRTGRGTDAGAASAQNAHTEIPMQDHRASPVRSRCRYSGQRTPRPSWSGICPGERAQTGTRDELRNYRPSTGASGSSTGWVRSGRRPPPPCNGSESHRPPIRGRLRLTGGTSCCGHHGGSRPDRGADGLSCPGRGAYGGRLPGCGHHRGG